MVEAQANGEPANTGWTNEAHLIASAADWAQVGAIASGNWKKKAPDFKPVERPFSKKKKNKPTNSDQKATSAADIHRLIQAHQVPSGG